MSFDGDVRGKLEKCGETVVSGDDETINGDQSAAAVVNGDTQIPSPSSPTPLFHEILEGSLSAGEGRGGESDMADVNNVADEVVVPMEESTEEPPAKYARVQASIASVGRPVTRQMRTRSMGLRPQLEVSKKPTPAKVLMTEESLRGNPRMYASHGRQKSVKKPSVRHQDYRLMNSCGSAGSDPPSELSIAALEDRTSTPSMTPLFRLYGQSSVKQASFSIEDVVGTSGVKMSERRGTLNMDDDVLIEAADEADRRDGLRLQSGGKEGVEDDVVEGDGEEGGGPPHLDTMSASMIHVERNQVMHNFHHWPLYWDRPVDFQEACDILIHQLIVDPSKVCTTVPQNFRDEGTFVVDLQGFSNRHDVSLDGLGLWGKPTGRTRFFGLNAVGKPVRIDDGKGRIPFGAEYEYKCMAKRYEHPRTVGHESRFIKKIFTAVHPPERETAVALAVVTYEWVGEPFEFRVEPHEQNLPSRRNQSQPPSDGLKSWEAASFASSSFDANHTVGTFFDQWPLYAVGAIDFGTAACVILGGAHIDISQICCRVPQGYRRAGTFVIDVRNFVTDAELRRDGNGAWGKPAGHSRFYKFDHVTGDAVRVDQGHKLIEGTLYDVQVLSKRYEHTAVGGRFVRKIYTGRSKSGGRMMHCSNLAVITYYWKGEPEDFVATPQRKVRVGQMQGGARYLHNGSLPSFDAPFYNGDDDENDLNSLDNEPQPSTSGGVRNGSERAQEGVKGGRSRAPFACSSAGLRLDHLSNAQMDSLRSIVYKREYENQERFSVLLDRAEAFLDRLERAGDFFSEQVWLASSQSVDQGQTEVLLTEDVINEGDTQFVHDGYAVNILPSQNT